jgi:hypothetical protein
MRTTKKTIRICNRATERRGTIVAFVGVMLVMLTSIVAFSTDVGYLTLTKTTLKAAADASALAAAGSMTQDDSETLAVNAALDYANSNVPESYGRVLISEDVVFGIWNPDDQSFVPDLNQPNAVKVTLERSVERQNPVESFFGQVLNHDYTELRVEAIAVGAFTNQESTTANQVYVTSSKDLSNVVLEFADGSHQKFEGISGYSGTFKGTGQHDGKEVVGVWIKSGCNSGGGGPGYGERIDNPGDGTVAHGGNTHKGCTPHVTATFEASGATFTESGFVGPLRLVK